MLSDSRAPRTKDACAHDDARCTRSPLFSLRFVTYRYSTSLSSKVPGLPNLVCQRESTARLREPLVRKLVPLHLTRSPPRPRRRGDFVTIRYRFEEWSARVRRHGCKRSELKRRQNAGNSSPLNLYEKYDKSALRSTFRHRSKARIKRKRQKEVKTAEAYSLLRSKLRCTVPEEI